jgi:hypothetical protein
MRMVIMGSKVKRIRTTKEDFIKDCTLKHSGKYTYNSVVWLGSSDKVSITCPIHGNFMQAPFSHKAGRGCLACSGVEKWTTERFINSAMEVHGNRYDYSKSVCAGVFNKVSILCHVHGYFEQSIAAHCRLGQGCPNCGFDKIPNRHLGAANEFISKANLIHGDKYTYSNTEYVRSRLKVEITCPTHGSFWQTPNNHLRGQGCGKCLRGGFTSDNPGYVYVLQDGITTKVGITNKTPEQRAKVVNQLSGMDFAVTTYKLFEDGSQARIVESNLLNHLTDLHKSVDRKFNGSTECFDNVDITMLLANMDKYSENFKHVSMLH